MDGVRVDYNPLMAFDPTELLNKPPGQLAAGGVLFGAVFGFFKKVEELLKDSTKVEIARWLRVKNLEADLLAVEAENWPKTFTVIFDRVFGNKHLSWKCFLRSAAFSLVIGSVTLLQYRDIYTVSSSTEALILSWMVVLITFANVLPDYISLVETRLILSFMSRASPYMWIPYLVIDAMFTSLTPILTFGALFLLAYHRFVVGFIYGSLAYSVSGSSTQPSSLRSGYGCTRCPAFSSEGFSVSTSASNCSTESLTSKRSRFQQSDLSQV